MAKGFGKEHHHWCDQVVAGILRYRLVQVAELDKLEIPVCRRAELIRAVDSGWWECLSPTSMNQPLRRMNQPLYGFLIYELGASCIGASIICEHRCGGRVSWPWIKGHNLQHGYLPECPRASLTHPTTYRMCGKRSHFRIPLTVYGPLSTIISLIVASEKILCSCFSVGYNVIMCLLFQT